MNIKVDIIIVGSGIAGCSLAWQWLLNDKSILLITDTKQGSSSVAAGVYNPTILKRFTSVWKAGEQLDTLNNFYIGIEEKLSFKFLHPIPILRRFHDEKEIKTWVKKSNREDLSEFMISEVSDYSNEYIDAPFGYGQVSGTGWLDTLGYMHNTLHYLKKNGSLVSEDFDFDQLKHFDDYVTYKDFQARKVIFAEGYKLLQNPYFKTLPMQGNKGEVLTIKVPGLKLDYIIKSSVFLMPYIDDLFWVGATYSRDDLSDLPTDQSREFLTSRLERFLKLPYEVVDHKHGIRPTSVDRRPFVGSHSEFKNYMVFNGMGSRAVLITPWAAKQLYDSIYNKAILDAEMDIERFEK
ncbi:MAG: FAD-dependent oxidoreductase [Nonlabens sp.]|uniref:NAD(P)/FAD-dependent oxidoreductase n=1 Tax=Nonlabens sp. TaxID=1888209 RepID=UPI00321B5DF5